MAFTSSALASGSRASTALRTPARTRQSLQREVASTPRFAFRPDSRQSPQRDSASTPRLAFRPDSRSGEFGPANAGPAPQSGGSCSSASGCPRASVVTPSTSPKEATSAQARCRASVAAFATAARASGGGTTPRLSPARSRVVASGSAPATPRTSPTPVRERLVAKREPSGNVDAPSPPATDASGAATVPSAGGEEASRVAPSALQSPPRRATLTLPSARVLSTPCRDRTPGRSGHRFKADQTAIPTAAALTSEQAAARGNSEMVAGATVPRQTPRAKGHAGPMSPAARAAATPVRGRPGAEQTIRTAATPLRERPVSTWEPECKDVGKALRRQAAPGGLPDTPSRRRVTVTGNTRFAFGASRPVERATRQEQAERAALAAGVDQTDQVFKTSGPACRDLRELESEDETDLDGKVDGARADTTDEQVEDSLGAGSDLRFQQGLAPPGTFVVTVDNGWALVESHLRSRGWLRLELQETNCNGCDLAWVSLYSMINFDLHRRGQLINHIPNAGIICDKAKLAETMAKWNQTVLGAQSSCGTDMLPRWMPPTFLLNNPLDGCRLLRSFTVAHRRRKQMGGPPAWWIVKPGSCNQGTGIFATDSQGVLGKVIRHSSSNLQLPENTFLASEADALQLGMSRKSWRSPALVQQYIMTPALLRRGNGFARKFDLRCFGMIARTKPLLVLGYPRGYARLSMEPWYIPDGEGSVMESSVRKSHEESIRRMGGAPGLSLQQSLRFAHLNNVCVQKEHPRCKQHPGGHVLGWEDLAAALSGVNCVADGNGNDGLWRLAEGGPPGGEGYAERVLQPQLFQIMTDVLWRAGGPLLAKREGYFELFGFDFMVEVDASATGMKLRPILLEVNRNPGLSCDNNPVLLEFKPVLVGSALDVAAAALPRRRPGVAPNEEWHAPRWKPKRASRAPQQNLPERHAQPQPGHDVMSCDVTDVAGDPQQGRETGSSALTPRSSCSSEGVPRRQPCVRDVAGKWVLLGDEQTGYGYRCPDHLMPI